jgi:hypothetical protein
MTSAAAIALSVLLGATASTGRLSPTSDVSQNKVKATGSTTPRSLASRAADVVNVKDYGAVGNGVADDTAEIQAAMTAGAGKRIFVPNGDFVYAGTLTVPANTVIEGGGYGSRLHPTGSGIINVGSSNVEIKGVRIDGPVAVGIAIGDGVSNVTIHDNFFGSFTGQAIYVWAATGLSIERNTFDGVTYGILQVFGKASSHVRVAGNIFKNMIRDAVELNCDTGAPSEDWIIEGNRFLGSAGYPTPATESRFVGSTSVKNLIIANNVIKNTAGDAAIHIENAYGQVSILGNTLENCTGDNAAGFSSYLWIIPTVPAADAVTAIKVDGNTFIHSDTSLPATRVLDTSSNAYGFRLSFTNNRVKGNGSRTLSGLHLGYHTGEKIITGNTFEDLDYAVKVTGSNNGTFSSNRVVSCNDGIKSTNDAFTTASNDWTVTGNTFDVSGKAIEVRRRTDGTQSSSRWLVYGNTSNANFELYDATDVMVEHNSLKSPATQASGALAQYALPTRCVSRWNPIDGVTVTGPGSVSADRGDTSPALFVDSAAETQVFATALTANRTITLGSAGAVAGARFRVVRTGLGAFTLDVGGLKTIPSATAAFVDVLYNGSAWVLTGYGTL